jgi:hypothetical protein
MRNPFRTSVILASVFTLCVVAQGRALAAEAECQSNITQVKALSSGPQHTEVNFNTDINGVADATGYFDPAPLLSTTIDVEGGRSKTSCLIAHLSVEVAPLDNHVMFQVLVDGVPMNGHGIFPYSVPTVQAPVVWDPEETDKNLTRMVAYSFFAAVGPGTHKIEVRFAGCCGLTNGVNVIALVRNAVLTLQY